MAKTVKRKVTKKSDASLKIETPYPKEEKEYNNSGKLPSLKSEDYWGEKMVKLQDRVNELELSLNNIHLRLDKVAGRLGM